MEFLITKIWGGLYKKGEDLLRDAIGVHQFQILKHKVKNKRRFNVDVQKDYNIF